ncbi:MAG TPA: glycosyltransferase family 39 protein [Pyrinomonadaceae bacterium]
MDGYYYVLQLNSLLTTGKLYYSSSTPVLFYLMLFFNYIIDDTVLTIKFTAIVLHLLFSLAIYLIISNLTKNKWLGLLGCALLTVSNLHLFMLANFIKSLCGLTFLTWAGFNLIKFLETKNKLWLGASVFLSVLAVFSHKSIFFILLILLFLMFLIYLTFYVFTEKWKRITVIVFLFILFLSPQIVLYQSLISLPQWLLNEISGKTYWAFGKAIFVEVFFLLVLSFLVISYSVYFRHRLSSTALTLFCAIAAWSILITLNPFINPNDYSSEPIIERLRALAYIQIAILTPGLLWMILSTHKQSLPYALAAIIPLICLGHILGEIPHDIEDDYLERRAQIIQNLPKYKEQLESSIVIAHHGDQFVVTAILNVPSKKDLTPMENHKSVYWLIDYEEKDFNVESGVLPLAHNSKGKLSGLIGYSALERLLETMEETQRNRFINRNKYLRRFLDSKNN